MYGTPAESLVYRFATIDEEHRPELRRKDGLPRYLSNSHHIHVTTEIDAFKKLELESAYQSLSMGGYIAMIEIGDLTKNIEALKTLSRYMYDTNIYAEFNNRNMA